MFPIVGQNKGFTLIEMLLVLVIFGLVIGIGITAWFSMRSSQQVSSAARMLKTASQCLERYVIHSEKMPPQSYFVNNCERLDPWGNPLIYENTGDNQDISAVTGKTFRDNFGDHPDAAWLIASIGPDGTRNLITSPTLWDCSTGDDLCRTASKNALIYEIKQ